MATIIQEVAAPQKQEVAPEFNEMMLLCEAAELLKPAGRWTKGVEHRDGTEQRCALGWINYVAVEHGLPPKHNRGGVADRAYQRLMRVIDHLYKRKGETSWFSVESFNDARGTSKSMVIKAFKMAGDCADFDCE